MATPERTKAVTSSTDGDRAAGGAATGVRVATARSIRLIVARVVLAVAALVSLLCVMLVIACFGNDRTIEDHRGLSVAEVLDTSPTRTAVRFNDAEGNVYIPQNGVLYPSGLQKGQLVRVEYDMNNPELVRVAGRTFLMSLLPVGGALAGTWAVLLPTYWLLRRRPPVRVIPAGAGVPVGEAVEQRQASLTGM